jgi:hypothetical protein
MPVIGKEAAMVMKAGERWHCMNPACGDEVLVEGKSPQDGAEAVCSCGSPMKKEYKPPVFRYLDFLILDSPESLHSSLREK